MFVFSFFSTPFMAFQHAFSVLCCPKPPWEDACTLMPLLLSCSTGKCPNSSWGCDPAPGCRLCLHKQGGFHQVSAVWLRKHIYVFFLESQTLHRTLLSIFCRLHQVLLGPRVKVEGAGLVPLIIGVLNVLQNSGVESCNPNSWEKVQTCILSFQRMPTWISLTEVEQPQGKFSGHTISNSK